MSSEQPLAGFELPASTAARPLVRVRGLAELQETIVAMLPDLRRAWHREGRPALHHKLKGILRPWDFEGEDEEGNPDTNYRPFKSLLVALAQHQDRAATPDKAWGFAEIRQIMEEENLFTSERAPGRTLQQIRSGLGKLLTRYAGREFSTIAGSIVLLCEGKFRKRRYTLARNGSTTVSAENNGPAPAQAFRNLLLVMHQHQVNVGNQGKEWTVSEIRRIMEEESLFSDWRSPDHSPQKSRAMIGKLLRGYAEREVATSAGALTLLYQGKHNRRRYIVAHRAPKAPLPS